MRYYTINVQLITCGSRVGSSPAQLRRRFRAHAEAHLYDESGVPPEGLAIYTLSDPRDIRDVRYVGQTSSPRRRFLQHLNQAQFGLPDERPWWVKQPKLRPLHTLGTGTVSRRMPAAGDGGDCVGRHTGGSTGDRESTHP
jgi:hypothetical protein